MASKNGKASVDESNVREIVAQTEEEQILVQVQLTVQFAPLGEHGLGAFTQPVAIAIPASEWQTKWATDTSRDVFGKILDQLQAAPSPVQS